MSKSNGKDRTYELSQKTMTDFYHSNLDLIKEMMDIEFKYANIWQDYLNAQMERLSTAKELSDVPAIEAGLATEYTNKFARTNRELYDAISEAVLKQMEVLNVPVDVQNMFPAFPDYEDYKNFLNPGTAKKNSSARKPQQS